MSKLKNVLKKGFLSIGVIAGLAGCVNQIKPEIMEGFKNAMSAKDLKNVEIIDNLYTGYSIYAKDKYVKNISILCEDNDTLTGYVLLLLHYDYPYRVIGDVNQSEKMGYDNIIQSGNIELLRFVYTNIGCIDTQQELEILELLR